MVRQELPVKDSPVRPGYSSSYRYQAACPVVMELKSHGLCLIIYLDDILLMASSPDILKSQFQMLMQLLQELGFILNLKKMSRSQLNQDFGLLVNSTTLSISLPEDKIPKVQKQCCTCKILNDRKASARELTQLTAYLRP